jgi:hypothetical protein
MIEFSVALFACSVLFSVFYWQVFNFVIIKTIRFQLFALRDQARQLAVEKGIGNSEHFKNVERYICKTIRFTPSISLTSFLVFFGAHRKTLAEGEQTKKEMEAFVKEAPKELVNIRNATSKFSLLIMVFNSPWMIFFAIVLGLVLSALGKISRIGIYRDTEKFVETLSPDSDPNLQPA